ncbi:LADA_0E04082g1_1 [Lachancea dasiensis]|uniref:LADA_0E04082g1_1 n=1 Tax=Lachancea dasiensis TaxID=1072105 RepID=A0A1G4JBN7_9SACH|nr:LADA_0E04082g1_1 [Lachancea dasiensis]
MRFALWAFFISLVVADIALVEPGTGKSFSPSGGTLSIPVKWNDDGKAPTLSKIEYYVFNLCYGNNDNIDCVEQSGDNNKVESSDLKKGDDGYYSETATFDSSAAGNGQYFLQVYGFIKDLGGGTIYQSIHYSPRFTLKSMKGTISPSVTTNTQPTAQVAYQTATAAQTGDTSKSFTVPYTKQTGSFRYAPMQTQPSGSVTATSWTRRFPTSAVTFYSTYQTSVQQASTITPGWSYTITSEVNWATPRPYPSQNGGWYDPKSRQTLTTRKLNLKQWVGHAFASSA